MDEDKQQKVTEFCSITGADVERAEFFLQAAGWNTGIAISTFFENDGGSEEPQTASERPTLAASSSEAAPGPSGLSGGAGSSKPKPSPQRKSRIQTFSCWRGASQPKEDADDDEEEEDDGQAYYAGGSEHSGQQILGPPRKEPGKVAEDLFKAAKRHGAEVVAEAGGSKKPQRTHFVGTGYRLGESEMEATQPVAGAIKNKEEVVVVLRLWRTGFTLNDGTLRPFDEPQNRQFLDSIHKGDIPLELAKLANGGKVALDMEDHSSEDYVPPRQPKVRAFTGSGQTLGSESSSMPTPTYATTSGEAVVVDASLPVTNIQIRLADGSRLIAKFNHSHTVGDIRRHVVATRPQYVGVAFSLITTLPSRQLTDDSVTLKDADLLNAAIMQKL